MRDTLQLDDLPSLVDYLQQTMLDLELIMSLQNTRYLNPRVSVPREGNLHLIYRYAQSPAHFKHFVQMVRVTPECFCCILDLIKDNPVFGNESKISQTPVETQLAVALFRFGRYGNGASLQDVSQVAGIGIGTTKLFTDCVILALLDIHHKLIRSLTNEERTLERHWVHSQNQFPGFQAEIFQYDGNTIPLWQKPGLNGDAYYSRHGLYELNTQVCSFLSLSNLVIS